MKIDRIALSPLNFFSGPLMIEESACRSMLATLNERAGLLNIEAKIPSKSYMGMPNGTAIISIDGPLSFKPDMTMQLFFGGASYEDIGAAFRAAMADPKISQVGFNIHSPGGDVAGVFDLVDEIYASRGQKPMFAVANEMAYSGAYAIASATDKIYIPRTGGAGSIGVIGVHIDQSQADAMQGLVYNMVFAGAQKADLSSHMPLAEAARERIQAEINDIHALFVDTVARNRGLKASAVKGQEAGMFRGKAAVDMGLADSVLSWNQAMNKMIGKPNKGGNRMKSAVEQIRAVFAARTDLTEAGVMAEIGYIPKIAEGSVIMTAAEVENIKQSAAQSRTDHVAALIDICTLAGTPQLLKGLIAGNVTIDAAKAQALEAKSKGAQAQVVSTVGAVSSGTVNPLIAEAQKRAAVK